FNTEEPSYSLFLYSANSNTNLRKAILLHSIQPSQWHSVKHLTPTSSIPFFLPPSPPSITTPTSSTLYSHIIRFAPYPLNGVDFSCNRHRRHRKGLDTATLLTAIAGSLPTPVVASFCTPYRRRTLPPPPTISHRWRHIVMEILVSRQYQHFLDKTTPHMLRRWIGSLIVACIYVLRIYLIQDFYIVSYSLRIYMLNLLIRFLFPQVDPEIQELYDGVTLPARGSDEFHPFVASLSSSSGIQSIWLIQDGHFSRHVDSYFNSYMDGVSDAVTVCCKLSSNDKEESGSAIHFWSGEKQCR
ncbi:uncharacterized protein LOC110271436, partial [Arachis ipaensis]|uniref:uncharacterized protein LOC110271436 n=1 Tax=Arachis ipaensis TaxID=130454 RepID=UPI000A2B5506